MIITCQFNTNSGIKAFKYSGALFHYKYLFEKDSKKYTTYNSEYEDYIFTTLTYFKVSFHSPMCFKKIIHDL